MRIEPGLRDRTDVFRNPDEQCDEKCRKQQWHRAMRVPDLVIDRRAAEEQNRSGEQKVSEVKNIMMRVEVQVDRSREQIHRP